MKASAKEWGLAFLLTLILLIFLLLIFDKVLMPLYTRHNREIEVPEVVEMNQAEADSTLARCGFRLVVESEKFDSHYPAGTIISQNPEALSRTKPGRRIYVTLSSGQQMCTAPNLIGKSERDAIFGTSNAGLTLTEADIGYEYSFYYPSGVIAAQSIPPGTKIAKGTRIRVTSSLGNIPSEFIIPSLVGQTLERAKKSIITSGLSVGTISYQLREDLLPNTVMQQTPEAHQPAARGQAVNLVVSTLDKRKIK